MASQCCRSVYHSGLTDMDLAAYYANVFYQSGGGHNNAYQQQQPQEFVYQSEAAVVGNSTGPISPVSDYSSCSPSPTRTAFPSPNPFSCSPAAAFSCSTSSVNNSDYSCSSSYSTSYSFPAQQPSTSSNFPPTTSLTPSIIYPSPASDLQRQETCTPDQQRLPEQSTPFERQRMGTTENSFTFDTNSSIEEDNSEALQPLALQRRREIKMPRIPSLEILQRRRLAANARERKRMNKINSAFDRLKRVLPGAKEKELSKFESLQLAQDYIIRMAMFLNYPMQMEEAI